jgi:hypothetical protein
MQALDQEPAKEEPPAKRPNRTAAGLLFLCLIGSLLAGALSDGVYHEDDLTHYLFARWSAHDPRYLLDTWGRPGFTIPYSTVAWIGHSADGLRICRVLSSIMAAATAWLAFRIAQRVGIRHAWAVIPLLYLQPLFARLSLTTLTETPLALYFALGTWLLLSGRIAASAAVIALGPITRDEAVVILPIWALAMWFKGGRWWTYPLLGWAILAHNAAGACWLNTWPVLRWLQPAGASHYGQGTPLTFLPKLALGCGPVIVGLAIVSARQNWRRAGGWIIVLSAATYFLAETAIYVRGAYSSGGYARFLVPICPWLAVLAASGVDSLFDRRTALPTLGRWIACVVGLWLLCELEWRWRMPVLPPGWETANTLGRTAALLLCVPLGIWAWRLTRSPHATAEDPTACHPRPILAAWCGGTTLAGLLAIGLIGFTPLRLTPEQRSIRDASPVLASLAPPETPLLTLNRWVYYFTNRQGDYHATTDVRDLLALAEPGTLFAWDKRFCTEPIPDLSYAEMRSRREWLQVWPEPTHPTAEVPCLVFFDRQTSVQFSKSGSDSGNP